MSAPTAPQISNGTRIVSRTAGHRREPWSRPAPAGVDLLLETEGGSRVMSPNREYRIGRDPLGDIVLTDPRVLWHHAGPHGWA